MEFTIQQNAFDGPLELLVNLIQKKKVHVTDINLSDIADEYIEYVQSHQTTISHNAEFLQIASTLLLIKSKALLPNLTLTEEETQSIEELEKRVALYALVQEHAGKLGGNSSRLYRGGKVDFGKVAVFAPSKALSVESLKTSLLDFINTLPKPPEATKASMAPIIRLEDMMNTLVDRVQSALSISFKDFSGQFTEKKNIIVSFLSVLELVKQQQIAVVQDDAYGDMMCEATDINLPSYE